MVKHYENFTVVSLLLPRDLRQHFCNIYAFCREADDMADEISDSQRSLQELSDLRGTLSGCMAGRRDGRRCWRCSKR